MLQKNPDLMKEIVDFADRFYARHRRSPSCREIAAGTTLKRSSVHNYLVAMNDKGMIEYNGQTILTPSIREMQQGIDSFDFSRNDRGIFCHPSGDITLHQIYFL